MPFFKKRYRKRFNKRRSVRRPRGKPSAGGSSWWPVVANIATMAAGALIKKYVNTERKYFDVAPSAQLPGTTGFVNQLTAVPLGTGASEREGRQFKATNLFIRLVMSLDANAPADAVRILVVQNRTDTAPAVTDVLTAANTLAPRNLNEVRDHKVLVDKTYNLDNLNTQQIQTTLNVRLGQKVQFATSDTAGQSTPEWGHLYLIAICRENTDKTSILYWSRLRYIDN